MSITKRNQEIMTPEQAADYLQVNKETIYRYIRGGQLVAFRLERAYRIRRRSLDLLLWTIGTWKDIAPRDYTVDEIAGFISADELDEEARAIADRFSRAVEPNRHRLRPCARRRRAETRNGSRRRHAPLLRRFVLIAAAGSPTGGSGFLLSLCGQYHLRGAVSPPVLVEAERNVREKLGQDALGRYHHLFVITPLDLTSSPTRRQLARSESIVGAKDAHILAAALASGAPRSSAGSARLQARFREWRHHSAR